MIRASSRAGSFGRKSGISRPVLLVADSQISVSTAPGKIVLTSMPSAITSVRSASEKPASANLLAQ